MIILLVRSHRETIPINVVIVYLLPAGGFELAFLGYETLRITRGSPRHSLGVAAEPSTAFCTQAQTCS